MADTIYQTVALFGLGFVLGLKHALDADHVVALSTFVSQTRSLKQSSWFGISWGLGHTLTLLLVGLVILGFRLTVPEKLALAFEFLVGILLVGLGVNVIRKTLQGKYHLHVHEHGDAVVHTHLHAHRWSRLHSHAHASFAVGMVHGLAGSAALALLVLTTVQSVVAGLLFILVFGAGSILAMFITTTLIAVPLQVIGRRESMNTTINIVAGTASVLIGCFLMYEIGVVNALFL